MYEELPNDDNDAHSKKGREILHDAPGSKVPFQAEIIWENVVFFLFMHLTGFYGIYLGLTSTMLETLIFNIIVGSLTSIGITAGAHRLWCHRSYKAKLPLKIFLVIVNTIAFVRHLFTFCRDHRVHHKFSDTDADPHNINRGIFFSHMGWLIYRKHPDVIKAGKTIDMSDMIADPVVTFQKKYYWQLVPFLTFVLPTATPMVLWGEIFTNSFCTNNLRFVVVLNLSLLVNSIAHRWGYRPYNRHINPADNMWMAFAAVGEGFHNYHHTFPWDYAASEYGLKYNITTAFIDLMAWLGLAYDLKTASKELIYERKQNTGEASINRTKTSDELHSHVS